MSNHQKEESSIAASPSTKKSTKQMRVASTSSSYNQRTTMQRSKPVAKQPKHTADSHHASRPAPREQACTSRPLLSTSRAALRVVTPFPCPVLQCVLEVGTHRTVRPDSHLATC
ncbi:hypothetical protein BVRB_4g094990 [Beta vulgaris subsp. vulgaris]|uniref:Uncharacterized protein n=1 Tax=Beta vulgaris subsp. vulgaris TaxID=3555 RepID=A0A0J8BBA9_BETVV|nr:hypothetical protein BVRB_4g094990 [Beta vulgaris subsp. vulgaris]